MTLEGEGIPCCAFGKVKASSYSSSSPSANSKVGGVDGTSQGMLSPSSARASSPGPPSVSRRASIARRMWAGGGAISPPRRKTIRMTHSASTVGAGSAVGLSSGEPSSSPPSSAVTIRCSTSKMMPLQLDVSALTHCTCDLGESRMTSGIGVGLSSTRAHSLLSLLSHLSLLFLFSNLSLASLLSLFSLFLPLFSLSLPSPSFLIPLLHSLSLLHPLAQHGRAWRGGEGGGAGRRGRATKGGRASLSVSSRLSCA
mmetsp:Transcript_12995/g.43195  ORF Transcript_12995/g.43195 Transcript_12995/m.43195 type:complete len:255 (-) Transcript_12995:107-871(-)